jgi:hypothetical protein
MAERGNGGTEIRRRIGFWPALARRSWSHGFEEIKNLSLLISITPSFMIEVKISKLRRFLTLEALGKNRS